MSYHLRRAGRFSGAWLAFLGSVVLFAILVGLLYFDLGWLRGPARGAPLVVYCAAGLRAPMEAAAHDYETRYAVPVQVQFGGSQTLLASAEVSHNGDLYIAADDVYIDLARRKGLIDEAIDIARQTAVVAVRKGNPRSIRSLDDLVQGGIKLAFGNPDAAAIGKVAKEALEKSHSWEAVARRIEVYKPTVNDVAADVAVGTVDAGIVWDTTVRQTPGLEAVKLPELAGAVGHVTLGVLRATTQPAAALRFARFLTARDAGLVAFRDNGFEPIDGDKWAEVPELHLLCGAMLRPAIEKTLQELEEREGVRISCKFNGCGILVAQMRTGEVPDAYFACDASFMDQVRDLFLRPAEVSNNRLVIIVPKGNPRNIHSLEDLAAPGLRVGIGHEKQCALGVLTQKTLALSPKREAVLKNIKTQVPTGDLLVNELLTKSLDAVVAYVSNAAEAADQVETIPVDVPCAVAVQPLAVSKTSDFRHLAERLSAALRSPVSRQRFESAGFHWQGPRAER
jgi:molybdenum ABC transporter molybdate-binding protein